MEERSLPSEAAYLVPTTMQLAGKADLSRLEKLEQQLDQSLNDVTAVRAKQVSCCCWSAQRHHDAPHFPHSQPERLTRCSALFARMPDMLCTHAALSP